ncbi:MAG: aminoglycoside phosphotransferase family protein [Clostridia bacterium]|nr:aminoglycoside phosphotransferase family protein [Clostridia bacterium]
MRKTLEILSHFKIEGEITECGPYGNGHINDTVLVVSKLFDGTMKRYILQSVNINVFKRPLEVMENIQRVTDFLRDKNEDERATMHLIPNKDGSSCYIVGGKCWRIYDFIEDSICLDLPETTEDFYQAAVAFGEFQKNLADFPAEKLYESIPDFHNTPKRYNDFIEAVNSDVCGRAKNVREEIEFVKARKDFCSVLYDAKDRGEIPLRVTHNDTKMNNVMLDGKTRKALCVIDLDTIMPGFSVTDFGDAIRFGASTASEDEKDLSKVSMDLEMFDIYTKGFLEGCGGGLLDSEIMLLPEGAKMMTLECGMRFLTDYLNGDTYFRVHYPEHNLDRCHTQFKLVSDMEEKWDKMKDIVKAYCKD